MFVNVQNSKVPEASKYIRDHYVNEVDILVFNEEYDKLKDDPFTGSLYGFLNTEYVFALVIIAVGISMIMFMAVLERKHEIANMSARGASFRNMMGLVSGEGITISLVGLIIGLLTGVLTAYVFNIMFGLFFSSSYIIERTVVFSWSSLLIVIVTILVLLFSSILVSLTVRKLKLNEILRWRGG